MKRVQTESTRVCALLVVTFTGNAGLLHVRYMRPQRPVPAVLCWLCCAVLLCRPQSSPGLRLRPVRTRMLRCGLRHGGCAAAAAANNTAACSDREQHARAALRHRPAAQHPRACCACAHCSAAWAPLARPARRTRRAFASSLPATLRRRASAWRIAHGAKQRHYASRYAAAAKQAGMVAATMAVF